VDEQAALTCDATGAQEGVEHAMACRPTALDGAVV
jgi:hypothetical protein